MAFKCFLAVSLLVASRVAASSEVDTFSMGLQKFSSQFYQTAANQNSGNIVTSPYSVQTAFLLLLMGAKDETADEIKRVFGLSEFTRNDIEAAYSKFHSSFSGNNFFKVANKIYASDRFTLKPSFVDIASQTFASEVTTIDFGKNVKAADEINSWVLNQTNGKIKDIVSSGDFSPDTAALIANAIYFKGEWEKRFKPEDTKSEPFWISEDESVDVDTMMSSESYKMGRFDRFKAIELNYKDSDISMMILLPHNRTGISNLEDDLANIDIFDVSKNLKEKPVYLYMPKFKIESELDLIGIFRLMGVDRMFSDKAEFDMFHMNGGVTVDKAVQKAFIEVDEKGTEAAAVTVLKLQTRTVNRFRMDHPFIYVIKNSEAVLFMGRIKKF